MIVIIIILWKQEKIFGFINFNYWILIMKKLCLITYTLLGETFTNELYKISDRLNFKLNGNFKVVVYCEELFQLEYRDYEIKLIKKSSTKYKRLIDLIDTDDSEYFISIDNDISVNMENIEKFIDIAINNNYEIAWGKIYSNTHNNFISKIIAVDKLLSHNIIRPLLWKLNIGISVPGQLFCIKVNSFKNKLIYMDTYLDDLALGLYANTNKINKYITSDILGYEKLNTKFKKLCQQRNRWAIGYSSILKKVYKNFRYLILILIHGINYHALWILHWIIIIYIFKLCYQLSLIYVLLTAFIIINKKVELFIYSIIYQFFFPILHIKWIIKVFTELIKKE